MADPGVEQDVPVAGSSNHSNQDDDNASAPAAAGRRKRGFTFATVIPKQPAQREPEDHYCDYEGQDGEFYTVDPRGCLDLPKSKKGVASEDRMTVFDTFKLAVKAHPDRVALRTETEDGKEWYNWTWKQHYNQSMRAARALLHLGVEQYDTVTIIGFNSPEWFWADLGAIACGAKAAGIYATNGPEAIKYIVNHSESKVAVLENRRQLEKFESIANDIPSVVALVMWADEPEEGDEEKYGRKVYGWSEFMSLANRTTASMVHERLEKQKPGECCTLIYTSGTTGNPKAVMISHDNLTWTSRLVLKVVPDCGKHDEYWISYLPLSHVAAQMIDIHGPMALTAYSGRPVCVSFALPTALKGTLGETLRKVRPTIFFGVPRVWEKIQEKMLEVGAQTKGMKLRAARFAKRKGLEYFEAEQVGSKKDTAPSFMFVANKVLSKVKVALGMDRCRFCFSGAAPITMNTLKYFGSLGIHVYQVYGMSECTGPAAMGYPGCSTVGSAGPPCFGVDIRIDHQPGRDKEGEGEICYRGRNNMMGYMGNEQKTKETIDKDGYLRSGDVGRIDENGMLWITGRIKELIITAGGENIAPVPIEDCIKEELPAVSNVMMVGDQRKYNVMLVTVKAAVSEEGEPLKDLVGPALEVDPEVTTVDQVSSSQAWKDYITAGIVKYNEEFAVSNAQKVQKFRVCPVDFSVPGGELTPTLKLKRSVVTEMYADLIEEMYNEPPPKQKKSSSKSKSKSKKSAFSSSSKSETSKEKKSEGKKEKPEGKKEKKLEDKKEKPEEKKEKKSEGKKEKPKDKEEKKSEGKKEKPKDKEEKKSAAKKSGSSSSKKSSSKSKAKKSS